MQEDTRKLSKFKQVVGEVFREMRCAGNGTSLTKLAYEYEIDKGSLSKLERGLYDCRISTAWRLTEANGIKFSEFALKLEEKLGDNFKFMDE